MKTSNIIFSGFVLIALFSLLLGLGIRINYSKSLPHQLYFSFPASKVEKGHIVTFAMPQSKIIFAKYIIGMPGDVLKIENGKLFINGCFECAIGSPPEGLNFITSGEIPDGFFFALGQEINSFDSRYAIFGLVPISAIKERLWPIF